MRFGKSKETIKLELRNPIQESLQTRKRSNSTRRFDYTSNSSNTLGAKISSTRRNKNGSEELFPGNGKIFEQPEQKKAIGRVPLILRFSGRSEYFVKSIRVHQTMRTTSLSGLSTVHRDLLS